jgi:hypothetical protein
MFQGATPEAFVFSLEMGIYPRILDQSISNWCPQRQRLVHTIGVCVCVSLSLLHTNTTWVRVIRDSKP